MADFRKCIPVLAVLALILGMVSTASAQSTAFTCIANTANPTQLRYEGLTELVGDIVIECSGGTPTAPNVNIPLVNISVFMGNTTVTSRNLANLGSEALLMLDEPTAALTAAMNQQIACPAIGGGVSCGGQGNGQGGFGPGSTPAAPVYAYYGASTLGGSGPLHYNIFQGVVNPVQPNAVAWAGIPIDPPGTNGKRIIRLTNIRINANALGVGTETSPPVQALAFLSVNPSTALPITNNATQVVGQITRSLTVSNTTLAFQQCLSANGTTGPAVTFTERFAAAWKTRSLLAPGGVPSYQDVPGGLYGSESGFYAFATGAAGLADFGTRFKLAIKNVPLGVSLTVPSVIQDVSGTVAVLVSGETAASVFATPVVVGTPAMTAVALTTSGAVQSGQAVYEVVYETGSATDAFTVPVYVTYTAAPSASPGLGTATVNGSYAPAPPAFDAALGRLAQPALYPIPRFVDTGAASNLFSINVCATNLLFPFVTNQVGFDTGLAIANTTQDAPVFATTPQEGTCTLYSYGANAPAAVVSPNVPAGTVWTALASSAMPNFQGYVIAHCTFQFAHGFAFVSDLGARNLAMGYLALVIPDLATRTPSLTGTANNQGEQLNQ